MLNLLGKRYFSLGLASVVAADMLTVSMARYHPIYRYSCRRVAAKLPSAEAAACQDAVRERVYLGYCGCMLSCIDQLCIAHGCALPSGLL